MKLRELINTLEDEQRVAIVTELGSAGLYRYPRKGEIPSMFLKGEVKSVRINKGIDKIEELLIEVE